MKFFVVLTVLSLCVIDGHSFFLKAHPFFAKKAEPVPVPVPVPPPPPPPAPIPVAVSSGSAQGGLGGLMNLIAIPLNFKKKLIQSHLAKIKGQFDKLGGAGAGAGAGAEAIAIGGGSAASGNSFSNSGAYSGSNSVDLGFSESSGGSASSSYSGAGNTYHPQPAPNTNYQSQPIVLHLYQIEVPSSVSSSQAVSGSAHVHGQDCNHAASLSLAPISQPSSVYGPPDYQPPEPISSSDSSAISSSSNFEIAPQVVQQLTPTNSYLPPN